MIIRFPSGTDVYKRQVLTHLCGGSAGREGAALQMGGSIGWNPVSYTHLDVYKRQDLLLMIQLVIKFLPQIGIDAL